MKLDKFAICCGVDPHIVWGMGLTIPVVLLEDYPIPNSITFVGIEFKLCAYGNDCTNYIVPCDIAANSLREREWNENEVFHVE